MATEGNEGKRVKIHEVRDGQTVIFPGDVILKRNEAGDDAVAPDFPLLSFVTSGEFTFFVSPDDIEEEVEVLD